MSPTAVNSSRSSIRPSRRGRSALDKGRHPRLYFGGASAAAERVAAAEADVQLFWGEPLDGIAERIDRLRTLSVAVGREHAPLEFGLRVTTLVRDTSEEAWRDAEAKIAAIDGKPDLHGRKQGAAVGQQRLLDLAERGEVLDSCLYTTPGRYGGGGAGTTWLVGSAAEVGAALQRYADLGVTHFVLSDTPYQTEVARIGDQLLPLLRLGTTSQSRIGPSHVENTPPAPALWCTHVERNARSRSRRSPCPGRRGTSAAEGRVRDRQPDRADRIATGLHRRSDPHAAR